MKGKVGVDMKRKKLGNRGFTLLELLATVTILGIIMTVTVSYAIRLISKAKDDSMEQQKNVVIIAAESYFQARREQLPRLIGQTTSVPISTLLETNYLKKPIKNSNGESCMEKSFVTAHKDSTVKYSYKAHLYCGKENIPTEEKPPTPSIKIDFCQEKEGVYSCRDKDNDPEVPSAVSEPFILIEIDGNQPGEETTTLEGYSWSISALYKGELEEKEVYNSGELSARGHQSIKLPKEDSKQKYILKNYVDITSTTKIAIHVIATNTKGGISEEEKAEITYRDNNLPYCGKISGQAESSQDWINKKSSQKSRKIIAECVDGSGSGCVRSKFTQTWPTKNQKAVEFAYIKLDDNAGNSNRPIEILNQDPCAMNTSENIDGCRVRVNVDLEAPVITLKSANKVGENTNILDLNKISNMTTNGTENDSVTLEYNQYKNLKSSKWMNQENYPNGIVYTFSITDNLRLASWKFETNKANGDPNKNSEYKNLSVTNEDAINKTQIDQSDSINNCGIRENEIQVSFLNDGIRKGKLTVTDIAGNTSTYIIEANLDRQSPSTPKVYLRKWTDNNMDVPTSLDGLTTKYTAGTWSNKNVYTEAQKNGEDNVSGISHFELVTEGATQNHSESDHYHSAYWDDEHAYWNVQAQRESTLKYKVCDKAGNCSNYNEKKVFVDKTAPTLNVYMKNYTNNKPTSINANDPNLYYGADTQQNVFFYPSGNDSISGINKYEIKKQKANAAGTYPSSSYAAYNTTNSFESAEGKYKITIKVYDKAGNTTTVAKEFIIDRTPPVISHKCVRLYTNHTANPSYDTLEQEGFLILDTKEALQKWSEVGQCKSKKGCKYAVIIKYDDTFSKDIVSRNIVLGDLSSPPNSSMPGVSTVINSTGTFNNATGKWSGGVRIVDHPGADDPLDVLIRYVCDRAGNCAHNSSSGKEIKCPVMN